MDAKGNISVPRVDTAVDCGFCVNPERVRSQIEGAAVMGLTLAKYGEITFKDGRVEQGNFNDYPIVRIDESPTETRVHIVEHTLDVHAERRRRARRSAVRAGAVQRDLRGDRKAHPQAADRRSARLTPPALLAYGEGEASWGERRLMHRITTKACCWRRRTKSAATSCGRSHACGRAGLHRPRSRCR